MANLLPWVKVRSFLEDLSDIDPSKFHFYDFGIQDFLVMRQRITLDEDNDESSSGGDYNQGLTIDPCSYLSDSEMSTGSVDLSAEQVVWEKRLVECPASLLKNRRHHASYKKSNSCHEVQQRRRDGGHTLCRRASDNLVTQSTVSSQLAQLVTSAACWNSDTDNVLANESAELDIGEDCGSGSSLGSQTVSHTSLHQSNTLPPVVTDCERPVQCSTAAEERCHSSYPCLSHALIQAGLLGGGRPGRRHLSTAHSAHLHRQPDSSQTAAPGATDGSQTAARGATDSSQTTAPDAADPGQTAAPDAGRGQAEAADTSRGQRTANKGSRGRQSREADDSGSRPCPGEDQRFSRQSSRASNASFSHSDVIGHSDVIDTMADLMDEPPQMTALERKLIMKKHPMLRNDTNAHILAPPDFRISMK